MNHKQHLHLTVTANKTSIDIKSDDISYACILGMYQGPSDGFGIQVNDNIDPVEAEKLCTTITSAVKDYMQTKAHNENLIQSKTLLNGITHENKHETNKRVV